MIDVNSPTALKIPSVLRALAKEHRIITILSLFAVFLLFTNLGREYLWADEGDTAVLARNILKFGVPKAWDGVTFVDSDLGKRLNGDLVMVSHPWLQYYLTAGSFLLFGENTFAARFPFALSGLAAILLTYIVVFRQTRNKQMAITAAVLVLLSVQCLIYSRQCRNYSLNAALTLLLVLQFYRLDSRRAAGWFTLTGILLFHTHPVAVAPLSAMAVMTLVYSPFKSMRKWFWISAPVICAFTAPWLIWARRGYEENAELPEAKVMILFRLLQFLIECASVTPVLGITILSAVYVIQQRRQMNRTSHNAKKPKHQPITSATSVTLQEKSLLMMIGAIALAYAAIMSFTLSPPNLWVTGLRHTPAMIPFAMIVVGILIVRTTDASRKAWIAVLLIFAFTKLGRLTPWSFGHDPTVKFQADQLVTLHVPPDFEDRMFRTGQLKFIKSLFQENPGTIARICDFINKNAKPDDILITNYAWEPLYFHTRLPQGMGVLESYPIYKKAREHHLPDYVFTPKGVRWVVWRRAWGAYRGHHCADIVRDLINAGANVEIAAEIPETVWENRENIHFHRFPDNDYNFDWFDKMPDAVIFRIDSPQRKGGV